MKIQKQRRQIQRMACGGMQKRQVEHFAGCRLREISGKIIELIKQLNYKNI